MRTFRPGKEADLETIITLEAEPDAARWLCEIGRTWHALALADPAQEHVVVLADDRVVGFGVLAGLAREDKAVEVRRIVVGPAHAGRGHGRALLRELVGRAYAVHGARRVWLDVKAGNDRAHGLYLDEGFVDEPDAGAAPFVEADGTVTPLIVMGHAPGLARFGAEFQEVVVDCAEPYRLAVFWARVLGGEPVGRDASWAYVDPPGRPRVAFQRVPEGKSGKNRLHLDVSVSDIPAATRAVELLGAVRLGGIVRDDQGAFQVLRDPEGNEFCLVGD
ncbi:GNAT family N-acetyltransferase [Yinghuangia sp. YIM S09857]|uniref:GNAT family N-acetyltransferase n=1 Tax=Yinghuangia sp. YIM S09857 TaxID=3436929 RepID=UPI003F537AFB